MLANRQYSFGNKNLFYKGNYNYLYLSVNNCERFEVLTILAVANHTTLAQSRHNLDNLNSTFNIDNSALKNSYQTITIKRINCLDLKQGAARCCARGGVNTVKYSLTTPYKIKSNNTKFKNNVFFTGGAARSIAYGSRFLHNKSNNFSFQKNNSQPIKSQMQLYNINNNFKGKSYEQNLYGNKSRPYVHNNINFKSGISNYINNVKNSSLGGYSVVPGVAPVKTKRKKPVKSNFHKFNNYRRVRGQPSGRGRGRFSLKNTFLSSPSHLHGVHRNKARKRKIYRYSKIAKRKLFKNKVLGYKALLNKFDSQKLMNDYNSFLALNILGLNLSNSSIIISKFKNQIDFNLDSNLSTTKVDYYTRDFNADSDSSHILYFKNNTIRNSFNTELINLKSRLPLKVNLSFDNINQKESKLVSNVMNSVTRKISNEKEDAKLFIKSMNDNMQRTQCPTPFNSEQKLSEGLIANSYDTDEDEEVKYYDSNEFKVLGWDEYVFTKLKYNKSLFKPLETPENKKLFSKIFNQWKSRIIKKEENKKKKLLFNSYYYKKYMVNSFSTMPYIVKVLWTIKIARKLYNIFASAHNHSNSNGTVRSIASASENNRKAGVVVAKFDLKSKLFFKSIEKFLGININRHKVLQISIKNLNLFNKFNSINLDNKLSFKDLQNLKAGKFVKTSTENSIKKADAAPLISSERRSLLGLFSSKNLNNIELQDPYIVNNLLVQKLLLSKYNSTDLRFKFLNIRLFLNLQAKAGVTSPNAIENLNSTLQNLNNIYNYDKSFSNNNTILQRSRSPLNKNIIKEEDTTEAQSIIKKEENIFKFRKAIIKLLHTNRIEDPSDEGSIDTKFTNNYVVTAAADGASHAGGCARAQKLSVKTLGGWAGRYASESPQINKKPNLRNLRLILKRFFVDAEEKNLKFNYKLIKTSKEFYLLSRFKKDHERSMQRTKLNISQINTKILNKNNNGSITSINNESSIQVSPNKTPNLKFLKILGKNKEIRKIKKISKYFIFNLAYRIRRYKSKKLGYFYFKSNSAKILSKVLPTVENAYSFYFYFNQNKFNYTLNINRNKNNLYLKNIRGSLLKLYKGKNIKRIVNKNLLNISDNKSGKNVLSYNNRNIKSGTIINISNGSTQRRVAMPGQGKINYNIKFTPANASKRLRMFMRKNFVNFMVQNYIYNSIRYPKDGDFFVAETVRNRYSADCSADEKFLGKKDLVDIDNSYNFNHVRSINNIIRSHTSYARNKMAFLTLSNRLPGHNNSTSLSYYGNIYKVIERNINNYKFKLYPHIFDLKVKSINKINFSNNLINLFGFINFNNRFNPAILKFTGLVKNSSPYHGVHHAKQRQVRPTEQVLQNEQNIIKNNKKLFIPSIYENKELINSTINYWLLEQEKQNKRTFMYPHLAMSTINRELSAYVSQPRINFLKINQLSFLYSEGDLNIKLINEFFVKILHLDRLNFFKYHNTFYFINHFTDFIKSYKKKYKKSHIKKFLSEDIKKLNNRRFKKFLFFSLFNFGLNFNYYLNYIYNLEMRDTQNRTFRIELKKARKKRNRILRLLNNNLNKKMFYWGYKRLIINLQKMDKINKINNNISYPRWHSSHLGGQRVATAPQPVNFKIDTNKIFTTRAALNKTKFKKSLYSAYKFGPYLLPYRKLLFLKKKIRRIISKKDALAGGLYIYRGINAENFSKMINWVRSFPADTGKPLIEEELQKDLLYNISARGVSSLGVSDNKFNLKTMGSRQSNNLDNIFTMYASPISKETMSGYGSAVRNKKKNRKFDYFNLFKIKNNFIYKIQRVIKKKVNSLLNRNKEWYNAHHTAHTHARSIVPASASASHRANKNVAYFKILYLFLIDKKLAVINLKELFMFEDYFTEPFMLSKIRILEKVYGKKARKALQIKSKGKKKYEKLLGLLKKKLESYIRKIIFKFFVFNKWKKNFLNQNKIFYQYAPLRKPLHLHEQAQENVLRELEGSGFDYFSEILFEKSWINSMLLKEKKKAKKEKKKFKFNKIYKELNLYWNINKYKIISELRYKKIERAKEESNRKDLRVVKREGEEKEKPHIFKSISHSQNQLKILKGSHTHTPSKLFNLLSDNTNSLKEKFALTKLDFFNLYKFILQNEYDSNLFSESLEYHKIVNRITSKLIESKIYNLFSGKIIAVLPSPAQPSPQSMMPASVQASGIKNKQSFEKTSEIKLLESYSDYLFNISLAYLGKYPNFALFGHNNSSAQAAQVQENYLKYNSLFPILLNKKFSSFYTSLASHTAHSVDGTKNLNKKSILSSNQNRTFKEKNYLLDIITNLKFKTGSHSIKLLKKFNYEMININSKKEINFKLDKLYLKNRQSSQVLGVSVVKANSPAVAAVSRTGTGTGTGTEEKFLNSLFKGLESNILLIKNQHNPLSTLNVKNNQLIKKYSKIQNFNKNKPLKNVPAFALARTSLREPESQTKANNYISNNIIDKFNNLFNYDSKFLGTEGNLALSDSFSPFFDFLIDNKNINKLNKIGLKKILSEFKFFRYVKYSGAHTGPKQIITYSFTKNINRTNTLNSFDHTGSLLKISISVILKYFFNLMGLALISKPIFIFSHNKVNIQISYFMFRNFYFNNKTIKNWNESVSTLSTGMQFYWLITNKQYRDIPKRELVESGKKPSLWTMDSFYSNRKPFDEKVKPFYPGNIPYLSQFRYKYYVFRKLRQLKKLVGGYWDKKTKKFIKNKAHSVDFSGIDYTKPYIRNTLSFFFEELNSLTYILEKYFNCSIKLELNRIKTPFSDPNIMAQLIGINGEEDKFEKIKRSFIYKFFYCNPNMPENMLRFHIKSKPFFIDNINSYITQVSGYKMRVAGRFYKHRIIPRKTVSSYQKGSMARGVVNLVEKARYVNKSKRGSFSVTVWISHIY